MRKSFLAITGLILSIGLAACNPIEESSADISSDISSQETSSSPQSSYPIHVHVYSDLIEEILPSYFYDGEKAHYYCSECQQYFDTGLQQVSKDSLKLPRSGDNVAVSVNGVEKGTFTLLEKNDNLLTWKYEDLTVAVNDVVTLTKPGDPTYKFGYFGNGNVDQDGKILTAGTVDLSLSATPNGFQLEVSGYKYPGIVVKVNDTEYPMNKTTYLSDNKETYIYGYHNFAQGDKMVVIDNINNVTYDYDDIENDTKWNVFDFHESTSKEFVFDKTGRYGIEFDRGGDKKISVTKTFGPNTGDAFQVAFDSERTAINMEKQSYAPTSEGYKETTWYINQDIVINADDIREAIANGLDTFMTSVAFEANEKFNIKDVTANKAITGEHLVSVHASDDALTIDGDYIKILKSGNYEIGYLPSQDAIMIYASTVSSADAYIMIGGNFNPLTKDANNVVTYQGHFDANGYCAFLDSNHSQITPTLDASVDATLVRLSSFLVYLNKAGTFKLELNLTTNVLKVTVIELDEEEQVADTPKYLSGKGGLFKTLVENPDNSDEVYASNVTISGASEGFYITFYDANTNGFTDLTIDADSSSYATVMMGQMIYITQDGTYNIYIHKTTHVVRLVKTA